MSKGDYKASNSHINSLICLKIKLVPDFTAVVITCVSDEDSIKDEIAIVRSISPKKVREKHRECHNHKPQPFPDPKRKRKPTNLNKHKPNKRTKSTKISSLFPKRGNRNTQEQNDTRKDIQQIAS